MPRLVFPDGFDEEERSPIGQTADYAAVGEDESTGCACNAGKEVGSVGRRDSWEKGWVWERYSLTSLVVCGLPTRT